MFVPEHLRGEGRSSERVHRQVSCSHNKGVLLQGKPEDYSRPARLQL